MPPTGTALEVESCSCPAQGHRQGSPAVPVPGPPRGITLAGVPATAEHTRTNLPWLEPVSPETRGPWGCWLTAPRGHFFAAAAGMGVRHPTAPTAWFPRETRYSPLGLAWGPDDRSMGMSVGSRQAGGGDAAITPVGHTARHAWQAAGSSFA